MASQVTQNKSKYPSDIYLISFPTSHSLNDSVPAQLDTACAHWGTPSLGPFHLLFPLPEMLLSQTGLTSFLPVDFCLLFPLEKWLYLTTLHNNNNNNTTSHCAPYSFYPVSFHPFYILIYLFTSYYLTYHYARYCIRSTMTDTMFYQLLYPQ